MLRCEFGNVPRVSLTGIVDRRIRIARKRWKKIFFEHSCLPAFGQHRNLLQGSKALSKASYAFYKILVQFKVCVMIERCGWCTQIEISAPIFASQAFSECALISRLIRSPRLTPTKTLNPPLSLHLWRDNITFLAILNPWALAKFWDAINKKDHVPHKPTQWYDGWTQ